MNFLTKLKFIKEISKQIVLKNMLNKNLEEKKISIFFFLKNCIFLKFIISI